jgi:tRNA A37 threonylcarbamoyltransferase TsaD
MADRTGEAIIADCDFRLFNGEDFKHRSGNILLKMIGKSPWHRPYLCVMVNDGHTPIATVSNKTSLRALAHRILKAIGDE